MQSIDSVRDKFGENVLVRAGIIGRRRRGGGNPFPMFKWNRENDPN
jgi:hypothetical protein